MKRNILVLMLFALNFMFKGWSNVSLPAIFGDHMLLQQNAEITLWGWAKPMEKIIVTTSWSTDTFRTEGDNQANWSLRIKTPAAGGPHFMKVQGYNTIEINDILIGEVWLLSGQSNMEWSARLGIEKADEAVKQANQNQIRFFSVTHRTAGTPNYDLDGRWVVCSPESMIDFSAVGYFFGKNIHEILKVPVGLINASWGGTPIEVWTPEPEILQNLRLLEASKAIGEMKWSPREPGRVFNAMIAPLMNFRIAGVLWYQGETNTANPETYTEMMQVLIESWRKGFQNDFPFYYAQIAPWNQYGPFSGAKLREAQRHALKIPKTGMIVVSDIGDTIDIHPRNKHDVGLRFAHLALNQHYGLEKYPSSGPLYQSHSTEGNKLMIEFSHANGLHAKGKTVNFFEIAGADGIWYPAKATITGNRVILSSVKVKNPVNARFAWSNTASPDLFNGDGLPASCFTTEAWQKTLERN